MRGSDKDNYAKNRARAAELESRRLRIREHNDRLRVHFLGGLITVTPGIRALAPETVADVLLAVRQFDTFNPSNDPHDEHDFGALERGGHRIMWKIDYYDKAMEFGSPDPSEPDLTTRVLTIMLASEY